MIYWLLWCVAHVLVRILYRVSYTGGSNLPRTGPVLVCANHLGWWDPVIFAITCRRRIYFMAKAELFRNKAFALLLRSLGAFPVRRGEPDRQAITRALDLLAKGRVVGIFPEGTRSYTGAFKRAEPGVGLLVLKSGAPVLPAYFEGPYRFRNRVRLVIGHPVRIEVPGDRLTGAERRQAVADVVMAEIAKLGGRMLDYERVRSAGAAPASQREG
ncbi:MAG: 1-acyl-sn-glycerol-3-phosphate acyltransferase [Firmicutes bacterium]|nr:1-acyl-sn-glycerol-3-phosphate acyltransferase [Bacillota bacterium]